MCEVNDSLIGHKFTKSFLYTLYFSGFFLFLEFCILSQDSVDFPWPSGMCCSFRIEKSWVWFPWSTKHQEVSKITSRYDPYGTGIADCRVPKNILIISPLQSGKWKNVSIQSVNRDFKHRATIILVPAPSLRRVWSEEWRSVGKCRSMQVHTDDHTTTDIRSILSRYIRTRRPVPRLKQNRQRLIILGPGSWHSANPWRPNLHRQTMQSLYLTSQPQHGWGLIG